jgi:hypothetical protein
MVDKAITFPRDKVRKAIGRLDEEIMIRVTRALAALTQSLLHVPPSPHAGMSP